jgi:splicing factor U2AF 35 kDa subunit
MYHLYDNPPAAVAFADGMDVSKDSLALAARDFDEFYEEIFYKLAEFGEIEELIVLDNINDHMIGNVYAKFWNEDDAERAMRALNGKYYSNRLILCEFSPVTDFRES